MLYDYRKKYRGETIVFYKNKNEIFDKSEAVIEICIALFPFTFFFALFKIIPSFLRDEVYMMVSQSRYSIFGKSNSCRLPSEEERERFLD